MTLQQANMLHPGDQVTHKLHEGTVYVVQTVSGLGLVHPDQWEVNVGSHRTFASVRIQCVTSPREETPRDPWDGWIEYLELIIPDYLHIPVGA